MKAQVAAGPLEATGPHGRRAGGRVLAGLGGAAALLAIVGVVVPFFASTYAVHHFQVPLGWDTPKYLWKTALASHLGVTSVPDRLPPPVNGSPDRPAFAVVALIAGRLGIDPVRVTEALPFAMAAAIGLASAGLASVAFGVRRWEAAVVGASVGASAWAARLAGPETYQDNLMVAAVVVAVAALAVGAAARGRGFVAPALLLGAAAVVHWSFALLFAGILVGAALVMAPGSWRAWRRGDGHAWRTPSGVLAAVAAGGVAAGVAALYGALGAGLEAPKTSPQARVEYDKKIRHDLAGYAPWLTLPGAAVGAGALGKGPGQSGSIAGRPRVAGALLGTWIGVALLAWLGAWAGATIPTHRLVAFALPIPFLLAVGAVALPRIMGRRRWSRVAGFAIGIGMLAGGLVVAQAFWSGVRPQTNPVLEQQASKAATYLDRAGVPADTPIVFVANVHGNPGVNLALLAHEIRAALPPQRIEHAYLYLGDPEDYLAGHPTIVRPATGPSADYDGTSWRYFRAVRPLLHHGPTPVALLLPEANPDRSFFQAWARAHAEVVPGVLVVAGPELGPALPPAAPDPPISAAAVGWSAVVLLVLAWIVGSGWATAASDSGFAAAALAPAIGVAVAVVAGVIADRSGIRLGSGGGLATIVVATAAGWALAAATGRRRAAGRPAREDDGNPAGELVRVGAAEPAP